jgi:hypothetical protein
MKQRPKETAQLPTDRAFVVQLTASTVISREHIVGRIEHVVSGQSARFQSLEGLVALLHTSSAKNKKRRILYEVPNMPGKNPMSAA